MRIILIILDGCPVSPLKKAETTFINEIIQKGNYNFDCEAVFPTATYTGHSSIITGCYPNRTGMVGNQFYDRKDKITKHFDNFDPNIHIEARTIFEYLSSMKPVSICEPIYKGAYKKITMKEIHKNPIKSRNELIYRDSKKYIEKESINFIMINFSAVDSIGEIFGPNSKEYKETIETVDNYIRNLYNISHSIDETILIITADHGLTEIKSTFNLQQDLSNNGFNLICCPSHRICHIYSQSDKIEDLILYLKENRKIKHVFNKNDIKKLKIGHNRSGDLLVVANDNIEFEVKGLKGSHGGLNSEEMKVPLLILGPNRYKFNLMNSRIIDILPTILDILKIKPKKKLDGKSLLIK